MMLRTLVLILLLTGCVEDSSNSEWGAENFDSPPEVRTSENATVYTNTGERQCVGGGQTLEEAQAPLAESGIDVLKAECAYITGLGGPAVCGGITLDIYIYEIRKVNLPDAEALGYESITELIDPDSGVGYLVRDCDTP